MDQILEKLETLIDDVERDNTITIENVLSIPMLRKEICAVCII